MPAALVFMLAFLLSTAAMVYPFRPFKTRRRALISLLVSFAGFSIVSALESDGPAQTPRPAPQAQTEPQRRVAEEEAGEERFWVTSERLNRRTCPSERCGVVGRLFFREAAQVLERREGWVRISRYYDAACVNGKSEYVDSGEAACSLENGIVGGELAEWVSARYLSATRPPDPAEGATGMEALIGDSDDFARHRRIFAQTAARLIESGRCAERDFRENGSWTKSSTHRDAPVYFIYCGREAHVSNRLYLNAETGEVFP